MVDHQAVAFRVPEERHVADTGVESVALELDAGSLELCARFADVRHANRDRTERKRLEFEPQRLRYDDGERDVAGLELRPRPPVSGFSCNPSVSP